MPCDAGNKTSLPATMTLLQALVSATLVCAGLCFRPLCRIYYCSLEQQRSPKALSRAQVSVKALLDALVATCPKNKFILLTCQIRYSVPSPGSANRLRPGWVRPSVSGSAMNLKLPSSLSSSSRSVLILWVSSQICNSHIGAIEKAKSQT